MTYIGIASYIGCTLVPPCNYLIPYSATNIDNTIAYMTQKKLNVYRMSFGPSWYTQNRPYDKTWIQYFLDHCPYDIIIDANHCASHDAADEIAHRADINARLAQVAADFAGNRRVIIEMINESKASDFYTWIRALVLYLRNTVGCTNRLLVDKGDNAGVYQLIYDPLDAVYHGLHYYFNSNGIFPTAAAAMNNVNAAIAKGWAPNKLINTECGANYTETWTGAEVAELNSFLAQCAAKGVSNCVWMLTNLSNKNKYETSNPPLIYPDVEVNTINITFVGEVTAQANAGETVTLKLTKPGGVIETFTTLTLADRTYSVSKELPAGTYSVIVTVPADSVYKAATSASIPFTVNLLDRSITVSVVM